MESEDSKNPALELPSPPESVNESATLIENS